MRLPRRVPWASISELDEVCSWIYANQGDPDLQISALNRLSAWRATSSLPLALESAQNLLAVVLQDNDNTRLFCSHLALRQGYAAAIIRFVNGLVDPLQLGVYARSIASIANQIGLPAWLVELRHAATHEDLPSLELLRQGAHESMQWLLDNYFLPKLNPSSAPPSRGSSLRPISPLLKQYKTLLKITTRDASLKAQYDRSIIAILRNIGRWFAEARLAANLAATGFGWDSTDQDTDSGDTDAKERWVLDRFCDAMLEKGALVPLSKRKRVFPTDSFFPPKSLIVLWEPLLVYVHSHHTDLPHVLVDQIITQLLTTTSLTDAAEISLDSGSAPPISQRDVSYDMCIARWAMWSIRRWQTAEAKTDVDFGRRAAIDLITGLGPEVTANKPDQKAAFFLLRALTADDPHLEEARTALMTDATPPSAHNWSASDTIVMDERLKQLSGKEAPVLHPAGFPSVKVGDPEAPVQVAPGWCRLRDWKASPIGVYATT